MSFVRQLQNGAQSLVVIAGFKHAHLKHHWHFHNRVRIHVEVLLRRVLWVKGLLPFGLRKRRKGFFFFKWHRYLLLIRTILLFACKKLQVL